MAKFADVILDAPCAASHGRDLTTLIPGFKPSVRDILKDLNEDLGGLSSASVIVCGVRNRLGAPSSEMLALLRSLAPHVGIFVVESSTEQMALWLPRIRSCGVDEAFCLNSRSALLRFVEVLNARVRTPPPEEPLRALWALWASVPLRLDAMHCVRNAYRPELVRVAHHWFGLSEKRWRAKFVKAGLPTPLTLSRFGRQLHVRELRLRGSRRSAEVASLIGFETAINLAADRRRVRSAVQFWPELLSMME